MQKPNNSKKILIASSLLLVLTSLTGCGTFNTEPRIQTVTQYITPNIQIQKQPKPVDLADVQWYVVTEENLEAFLEKFRQDNGTVVMLAMTVRGYENMSVNMQELRRYINQQKQIIIYYEEAIEKSKITPDINTPTQ
jgi:hypothetical protein